MHIETTLTRVAMCVCACVCLVSYVRMFVRLCVHVFVCMPVGVLRLSHAMGRAHFLARERACAVVLLTANEVKKEQESTRESEGKQGVMVAWAAGCASQELACGGKPGDGKKFEETIAEEKEEKLARRECVFVNDY